MGELTVRAYAAFTLGPADPYIDRLRDAAARAAGAELWVAVAGMAISSLARMSDAHRIYARLGYVREPDRDWSPLPGVDLVAFSKAF